ncbi:MULTISPECIES: ATP-dependent DNA helicase UvrD2 [Nocardiopsis]|uniref:DNA 3'-5' helicase n=1 Tax=Nocardiopsis dassonvillei (strain ATCC 23218 / DSM 43111 / CIP 107115 / JCM 7437 / KCTC 9190 / NBRC 14626 / NCTC 10488 / NRRL B-5397 / IMRU 509) TaxID=446468 RepID=D7B5W1_NOCDD|nr:ATP-dependent DNA helicase UvrD2 [Nocardiopsis dassonvillei]ADH69204.1 UvrD/REP helicase [Nocardiopsis dassonvillei subsp. dassonvillei DSM 43111]APC37234.1 ATP-dependent DNA helicase [Nocardiopsis dassonvillei]NKY79261.1 ATP-dependent DNA helicase UvrD2 [Nocardiopsis dassonvillei]VEI89713.1 ATP-dependent DNA helicase pcrA [Nocardiopsis dassonvillei]
MDPDRVLEGLDPEQTQAARALRGPVCILAGAGTGKTRAITHRIAYAVSSGVVAEQQVLAVTFTARAAGEMRGRLRALGAPRVQARTFHAAALRQLSFFWPQVVGGEKPTLIESKLPVVSRAAHSVGLQPDRNGLRDLAGEIEWSKVTQVRPTDYDKAVVKAGRQPPLPAGEVARVFEAYEDLRREHNLLDFESMLELTAGMITEYPAIAQRVREQYRYFVVDEFQDVNPLQRLLLDAWLGDRDDLCVVGDPSQTIYSFAGATPGYLTGFGARYPHATVVQLVRDYRSTPQVVRVANHVIAQARGTTSAQHLTLQAQRPDGPDPMYQEYDDEPAEATGVARKISVLLEGGTPASEIAVLVRTNGQSASYEQALTDEGVPFTMRGTTRFFERPEIKQAVHTLRGARHGAAGEEAEPLVRTVRQLLGQLGLTESAPEGRQARERWESLTALAQLAEDMAAAPRPDGSPVTMADLVDELDVRMATEHAPGFEGVTIASLHAAKGLEWDAVFLVGLTEGMMPIIYAETDEQVEEERRLFYVGVTRAREHLAMSWSLARSPGGRKTRKPSRFLDGLRPASPSTASRRAERRKGGVTRCRVCSATLTDAAERKLGRCLDCPSSYDEALLERLRDWRRACAQEQKVPAYVIFTDATLQAVAEQEPGSLTQLAAVSGVGAVKLDRYGEAVLALVAGADPADVMDRRTEDDGEEAADE